MSVSWKAFGAGLLGLLFVAAGVTWFLPAGMVFGAPHTDLINQFAAWRAFAAGSVRAGDFPLWNPYTYGGQPFLGGLQSGLFYPPNVVFLVLPLDRALNLSILLHLIIAGAGMCHWALRRGVHPAAAAVTGVALVASGPVLPHVYAGHLSNVCTLAWAPWAFAGLEAWWLRRHGHGLWLASAATCLQILGGQIQYVFFFGVAAALHAIVVSVDDRDARRRAIPGLALCVVAASALAAAQLVPSLATAAESVRSGRLDYRFTAVFALPPENLLTAFAPGVLGGGAAGAVPYWGRCYPWEMSLFVGVGTLVLAARGLCGGDEARSSRRDLVVAGLLLVLALGHHLPVYRLLYEHVPGFDRFRGMSKFTYPAVLFLMLLAARGADALLRAPAEHRRFGLAAILAAAAAAAGGLLLRTCPELLEGVVRWMRANPENDFPRAWFAAPDFAASAARHAGAALLFAAAAAWAFGTFVALAGRRGGFRWAALAVVPLESIAFAATQVTTSSLALAVRPEVARFVAENPGDYRIVNRIRPNNGYLLGVPDLWGNDPLVLQRYAEFMTVTQGGDPDAASQNLVIRSLHPWFAMLRCRYGFMMLSDTEVGIAGLSQALPRALLVSGYCVRSGRDAILAEIAKPDFDPSRTIVLESEPSPRPEPGADSGRVRVVAATSDTLTLEAEVSRPALLLVTDNYSRDWRARALADSAQADYEVLPANYVLRAVPLAAGRHRLRMEYAPAALPLGLAISTLAWLGWAGALAAAARWKRIPALPPAGTPPSSHPS